MRTMKLHICISTKPVALLFLCCILLRVAKIEKDGCMADDSTGRQPQKNEVRNLLLVIGSWNLQKAERVGQ